MMRHNPSPRASQDATSIDSIPLLTQNEDYTQPQTEKPRSSSDYTPLVPDEELDIESPYDTPRSSRIQSTVARIMSFFSTVLPALIPTFIYLFSKKEQKKLRPTASLDGLRGMAALLVTLGHYYNIYTECNSGFIPGDKGTHSVWNLPIFKLFYSGKSMVFVFFVISGYVLSLKSIRCMRQRDWSTLLSSLASSTFRRGMRLYGPTVIIIAMICFISKLGFWVPARANNHLVRIDMNVAPKQFPTWGEQFHHYWWVLSDLLNVWKPLGNAINTLDPVIWTIPIEFKGSIIIFILMLGTCKIRQGLVRKALMGACLGHQVFYEQWDVVLFFSGMLLAEYDTPSTIIKTVKEEPKTQTWKAHLFWAVNVFVGCWLCSSPFHDPHKSWGYIWITPIASFFYRDVTRFWPSVGAIILVNAATKSHFFKWFLTTRIVQYLGDVSFSVYLVHSPFYLGFAAWWVPKLFAYAGANMALKWFFVDMGWVISMVFVFIMGDWVWRFIDTPCVNFARWLEGKVFLKED